VPKWVLRGFTLRSKPVNPAFRRTEINFYGIKASSNKTNGTRMTRIEWVYADKDKNLRLFSI